MRVCLVRALICPFFCLPILCNHAAADACSSASTPLLNAICADPEAKTAYNDLEADFAAASRRLTSEGRAILDASEKKWELRFSAACIDHLDVTNAHHSSWLSQPMQHCLIETIVDRRRFLAEQGRRAGDYTWQTVEDIQESYCSNGNPESAKNFISISITHDRIDSPPTDATRRWNAANEKTAVPPQDIEADACKTDGTVDVGIGISYADGDFVQITDSGWQDYSEMPHPQSWRGTSLEIVSTGRKVQASDIFREDSGWQSFVGRRLFDDYMKQIEMSHSIPQHSEPDLEDRAADTNVWTMDDRTLTYDFGSYDLGGYADADFSTTFNWKELRRYLRSDLPFHPNFN